MQRKPFHAAVALMTLFFAAATGAQTYPTKPVRVIVPYGPGGSTDLTGRTVSQKLQEALGQPFVVENKPGASAQIGAAEVAKAAPDGYTLLVGAPQMFIINPLFFKDMRYDAENGFTPIAITLLSPNYILAHPDLPAKNLQELIAHVKANPGKVNYASSGVGSSGHLTGLLLNKLAGIDMQHIGYKGSAGAVQDTLSGQVQVLIDQPVPGISHVRAGKLRAIAVGTSTRVPALPDVPTVHEQGVADFESSTWFGFWAPAGTPKAIVDRLWGEIQKIMKMPDVQDRFAPAGYIPTAISPEDTAARVKADREKWTRVAREAGIKPE
jgi:tripartite-type tricarboxylate transporter receptor subunit TctC